MSALKINSQCAKVGGCLFDAELYVAVKGTHSLTLTAWIGKGLECAIMTFVIIGDEKLGIMRTLFFQ